LKHPACRVRQKNANAKLPAPTDFSPAVTRPRVGKGALLVAINNIRDGIVDKRGDVCGACTRCTVMSCYRTWPRGGSREGGGKADEGIAERARPRARLSPFGKRFSRSLLFSLLAFPFKPPASPLACLFACLQPSPAPVIYS